MRRTRSKVADAPRASAAAAAQGGAARRSAVAAAAVPELRVLIDRLPLASIATRRAIFFSRREEPPRARPAPASARPPADAFLQKGPCFEVAPRLAKCRECRWSPAQRDKDMCRFDAFRRLKYGKNRQLTIAGFSDPYRDANEDDKKLWLSSSAGAEELDIETSCFLLREIGDQFCELLQQEKEAESHHLNEDKTVAWKRVVQGVREICDVCDTTLFNYHWTCGECGFVVCLDCYKPRTTGEAVTATANGERDSFGWLTCTSGGAHEPRRLLLTQFATGGALAAASERAHAARAAYRLPPCKCGRTGTPSPALQERANRHLANIVKEQPTNGSSPSKGENGARPPAHRDHHDAPSKKKRKKSTADVLDVISKPEPEPEAKEAAPFAARRGGDELPARIMTLAESKPLYPDVPHAWLCDGRLLHLTDPTHPANYEPFRDQWKRGQPVLVSGVSALLDEALWSPESFSRDFGDWHIDLIDCASGRVVPDQPARKFWDGFERASERLRDERGAPMVLKLKDWPPDADFAERLPTRFDDLMRALPLAEYTARGGRLNLAARLPDCFVRPDLGPKMYTAYGGAGGTTNLHLDVSDAVNVLVHASAPADAAERAWKAARDAGVEKLARQRAGLPPPAALWHIYAASDTDKIRHCLEPQPRPDDDPVHDQTRYLDAALRERLYREYGVEGYTVLQCAGDAVFVPAGAPHQVRNLLDCIKVAEDFVSPENVSRCLELSQQFRRLSRNYSNKEDKLQIKSIVYHAIKDSLCRLEGAPASPRVAGRSRRRRARRTRCAICSTASS